MRHLAPRHAVLGLTLVVYSVAVRQVEYRFASGLPLIEVGLGWHWLGLAAAGVGIGAGVRIAWVDLIRRPAAPRWIVLLGWAALMVGGILALGGMVEAGLSGLGLPPPLPGARVPPLASE